jgi:hypothetical protein
MSGWSKPLTGYGDDTWEPCSNLLTPQVEAEAIQVRGKVVSLVERAGPDETKHNYPQGCA